MTAHMTVTLFILLVGLQLKHCVADYFLQPGWMLAGKGDLGEPGGYAHAGIHAGLSGVVLILAGLDWTILLALIAGEFVIHYLLDFAKIRYSRGVHVDTDPQRFWALHGVDQLAHQLTYAAMIFIALSLG